MIETSCHCGAVGILLPSPPDFVVDCNCSICRRNGALWAFYAPDSLQLIGHPDYTTAYVWGQGTIRTMRCKTCGCVTHWEPIELADAQHFGINMRNAEPSVLEGVRVRKFDGAQRWDYID